MPKGGIVNSTRVVLDTNIWVAGTFNPRSHAAQIIVAIRAGSLHLVWNGSTRDEIRRIFHQIPPLCWESIADLFRAEEQQGGDPDVSAYDVIPDPSDRPFAALAGTTGAVLISNDEHLLSVRGRLAPLLILSPREFVHRERTLSRGTASNDSGQRRRSDASSHAPNRLAAASRRRR